MSVTTIYRIARTALDLGRLGYVHARLRVQAYADREGISEREAWLRINREARRRGDEAMTRLSDSVARVSETAVKVSNSPLMSLSPGVVALSYARNRRRQAEAGLVTVD